MIVAAHKSLPGDPGKDNTSAEGRCDQLLGTVRKLQQDEKVHCAHLVVYKLRMNIVIRIRVRI